MKILLIEDDDMDAEAAARMLRRINTLTFTLERCGDLRSALAKLKEDRFEVLLLDLGLPDSSGTDAVRKLARQSPEAAIIVQTGFDSESAAMEAVAAGAQDYLIKGRFDPDSLLRSIRYASSRKGTENQLREVNGRLEDTLKQLMQAQSDLVRSERMSAVGHMSCGIAHDFNNALTPILGSADYLLSDDAVLEDRESVKEMLEMIRKAAEDAAGVVRRLRVFYQVNPERDGSKPIDLEDLLADVRSLARPKWRDQAQMEGKAITVELEILSGCLVAGDPGELREALLNLVFNSVDAIDGEGTIVLRGGRNSTGVNIEVADDGGGMSGEMADRCFEPFVSGKGAKGSGLGLATTYGIVEKHHGSINVRSEEGVGTTFIIRLPAYQVEEPAAPVQETAGDEAAEQSLRILLVDDESSVRFITKTMLTRAGHDCTVATGGEDALERFAPGRFDLVLTDRSMPGISGDELARKVRDLDADIPILMLTGYGEFMNAAHELPAGVDRVLTKPFKAAAVREAITALVKERGRRSASDG